VHQDKQDVAPSCLSVAPCSDPSRRGLATLEQEASQPRRPALTAPLRPALQRKHRSGRRNEFQARTKELDRERAMT
jgi:hypothetical protein